MWNRRPFSEITDATEAIEFAWSKRRLYGAAAWAPESGPLKPKNGGLEVANETGFMTYSCYNLVWDY